MRSDYEIAVRREPMRKAHQHLTLKRIRKIGECDVATQNEIETYARRFPPQILFQEFDALSMFRLDAVKSSNAVECQRNEMRWQFAQTGWLKAASVGPGECCLVDIGRQDCDWSVRKGRRYVTVPDDFQRIRLFTRGAADGPDAGRPPLASGARCDVGKREPAQGLEYASVPVEARDGDRTAFIEGAPLRRICLEATAIGHEILKSKLADSPVEALADLAAHFAKPKPAEITLRECPLGKGGAISIVQ